jgi:hypothetical protein
MKSSRTDRLGKLCATVSDVPSDIKKQTALISNITQQWAALYEADKELALELARKLPSMQITRI